jgi:hypothetical protein
LLFTYRQIDKIIGKNKSSAQKFCKTHEQELLPTVTAIVPDKPRPVALSSWSAALAYWSHQAQAENTTAIALVEAKRRTPESELQIEVVSNFEESNPSYPKGIETAIAALPTREGLPQILHQTSKDGRKGRETHLTQERCQPSLPTPKG